MNVEAPITGTPDDTLADLGALAAAVAAGREPDAELVRRVRERSRRSTADIRKRYGELNLAADLTRQVRDEA